MRKLIKLLLLPVVILFAVSTVSSVTWVANQYGYYATSCNFTTTNDDLTSVYQLSFERCMALCVATANCTHLTWSINNGSTCNLKRGSVFKTNTASALDPLSACGIVSDGVDLSTIWSTDKNSFLQCDWNSKFYLASKSTLKSACYSLCQKYAPTCTQYSWSTNSGCRLYMGLIDLNLLTHLTDTESICGYISYNNIQWQNNQATNCTWPSGNEITNIAATLYNCPSLCAQRSACTHYLWVSTSGGDEGTCYLKSGFARREYAFPYYGQRTVCGQIFSGVTWSSQMSTSPCDWNDASISTLTAMNSDNCYYKCQITTNCTHFTYSLRKCKLYSGKVIRSNVVNTYNTVDNSMICGYISNGLTWYDSQANCEWNDTISGSFTNVAWDHCDTICTQNDSCTHWSWTTASGGTCSLRKGTVKKSMAYAVSDPFQLCGLTLNGINWDTLTYASSCKWTIVDSLTSLTSKSLSLAACSAACNSTPSICSFFSWSSPSSCNLYSGTVNKAYAVSSVSTLDRCGFNNGSETIIWLGSYANRCTFTGNDLSTQSSVSFYDCINNCTRTLGCTHYVFIGSPLETGTCTLKSTSTYKYMAAYVSSATNWCGLVSDGVDWSINTDSASNCDWTDSQNMTRGLASSATLCASLCSSTSLCTHYTYSTGYCWLKKGLVDLRMVMHTTVQDMVCGYVSSGLTWYTGTIGYWAYSCYWVGDTDLTSQQSTADNCATLCANTYSCTHYIWIPATNSQVNGTCYPKGELVGQEDALYSGNVYSICGII